MKIIIYDKNPGSGIKQSLLKISWMIGCWFQKLIGKTDEFHGADSWNDVVQWICKQPNSISSIQYWGHGSPGNVWLSGKPLKYHQLREIKDKLAPDAVIWFRTCSSFQGKAGYSFAENMSLTLNCTIAAHTRIVGLFQGGLHTIKPGKEPSWPISEGELPSMLAKIGLQWGNNSVFFFSTDFPKDW